jgi:hypothetical protein
MRRGHLVLLLCIISFGCGGTYEHKVTVAGLDEPSKNLAQGAKDAGTNVGSNFLNVREMQLKLEERDRTIQEQKDRIRELELIAQGKKPPEPTLKVGSFPVILHSQNKSAQEALNTAGNTPNGGVWTVVQTNPDGRPVYTHPNQFGSRIVHVWWTETRADRNAPQKWGALVPSIGGPRKNQVVILSSAQPDAGHREGIIHVLYID